MKRYLLWPPVPLLVTLLVALPHPARAAAKSRVVVEHVEVKDAPTFRVYFDFLNEEDRPVTNLDRSNVTVLIDGEAIEADEESTLAPFKATEERCAFVLLLNNYAGYQIVWEQQKRGLQEFVRGLRPKDVAAVYVYSDQVRPLVDFTSDKDELIHAINAAASPDTQKPQEVFIDAVIAGLDAFPEADPNFPRRRGIVLMTDALDQGLENRQLIVKRIKEELVSKAKARGVKLYALGYSIESKEGLNIVKTLQKNFGGSYREVRESELARVGEFFSHILDLVYGQYVLTFQNDDLESVDHSLQISVNYKGNTVESVPETFTPPEIEKMWWGWWVLIVLGGLVGLFLVFLVIRAIAKRPKRCPECGEEMDPEEEHVCRAEPAAGDLCSQCGLPIPAGSLSCESCLNSPHRGRLTTLVGPVPGRIFVLKDDITIIGSREGSIRIPDPTVSGKHAGIRMDDKKFELADFDSTNGTYVNGKRVTRQFLKDGDVVRLGKVDLRFSLK